MPPKSNMAAPANLNKSQKRKEPPQSSAPNQKFSKGRDPKRAKIYDARTPIAQNADAALKNGELDLQAFLKAREFEIKALEDGKHKSKSNLTTRAFQQVPRDMRRRTASHNVKRVPKRLLQRAKKEMKDDNTPTVNPSKRKPKTTRGRLRAETAKRLGILAAKKRAQRTKEGDAVNAVETRAARPKIRKNMLNDPPKPIPKFRKRQIHKTWLPTHMWHAKRARMTEAKKPLWRFAIPTTSTEKSYRPTHRASGARGAVAWDMSYMSTIRLQGVYECIQKLLKHVGLTEQALWSENGKKWRHGKRAWSGWLSKNIGDKSVPIGPSTVVWCCSEPDPKNEAFSPLEENTLRQVFVRVHPSIFLETWEELLRLSKPERPHVRLEDLRFEIGSIDITGPGSTETLLGILHPYDGSSESSEEHGKTFKTLAGLTNPGTLPANAVLTFSIMDPRLRYPSRRVALPNLDEEANLKFLELLASWPVDASNPSTALFDRNSRFKATRLPAQKSINRRKGKEPPGAYPTMLPTDPSIPIMLLASRSNTTQAQGTWTLLAPWKCILPIWYGLVHHPLTSGGNPRFGGLDELRQVHFEHNKPWFPADYPGTTAGFAWEAEQREIRKEKWDRRPKGKRVEWASLDLGAGRKGEIGRGWACDFEKLIGISSIPESSENTTQITTQDSTNALGIDEPAKGKEQPKKAAERPLHHLTKQEFTTLLSSPNAELPPPSHLATIHLKLLTRGIASPCARIYRLPPPSSPNNTTQSTNPPTTRDAWLATLPPPPTSAKKPPNPRSAKRPPRIPLNAPVSLRTRLLAQSLVQDPPAAYPGVREEEWPLVPGEEDLIGFITTGEFNLVEGRGTGIGCVCVEKIVEGLRRVREGDGGKGKVGRLCIVRNAGESIGRLARWEVV